MTLSSSLKGGISNGCWTSDSDSSSQLPLDSAYITLTSLSSEVSVSAATNFQPGFFRVDVSALGCAGIFVCDEL
ncbi:hypothetical protein C0J52_13932 [Blattella germanica]|nr:hypothetical protein C0J52_13932 [Blattella germanica]